MEDMEACHCGSQKPSDQCCIPTLAPIHSEIPRFIRSSKIYTPDFPFFANQIKVNYGVVKGPAILSQIDPLIAEALGFDLTQVHLFNPSARNTLVFPLHAVRYHLQQFMYRLRLLQNEIGQSARRAAKHPHVELIQCEDVPLRSELEAYIIRLAAYLDALAHYVANSLHYSVKNASHNKVSNRRLSEETGAKRKEHQAIRETYEAHEEWVRKLLDMRHEVMHEGISMDMSIPADFFETNSFIPRLSGESVEEIVIIIWSKALTFTRSIINLTA
jgi:hypothetical protein